MVAGCRCHDAIEHQHGLSRHLKDGRSATLTHAVRRSEQRHFVMPSVCGPDAEAAAGLHMNRQ